MSISLPTSVYKKAGAYVNKFAKTKFMTNKFNQSVSDPARFAAAMLVTSIVSKDLVGCALYTTQSLNNQKIPEEKRKFVAALDLMNGILMVGGQFLVGKVIDAKLTPKLLGKFTGIIKGKTVNTNAMFHPDNIAKKLKESGITDPAQAEKITKQINKLVVDPFKKGFGIIVTALATTALTKRTIVPFLSTPLAGKCTDYLDKKDPKHKNQDDVNKAVATATYQKTDATNPNKKA